VGEGFNDQNKTDSVCVFIVDCVVPVYYFFLCELVRDSLRKTNTTTISGNMTVEHSFFCFVFFFYKKI